MKRRTFLMAGALASGLSIAACSSNTTPGTSSALDTGLKAELNLAYWDKNQAPTIEANIKAFNQKFPNVKVTTSLSVYDDYWTKLRTQAEGNKLPDVFWMNGPNIQLYGGNGMLAPLNDLPSIDWSKYPQSLVELYKVGGTHYGVPKDFDTVACWINKELFQKAGLTVPTAGWTWDEFKKAAQTVADKGVGYGVVTWLVGGAQVSYYNTIAQAGGYVIKDGASGYNTPEAIRGLQFWADLIKSGAMPSLQVLSDTDPDALFTSGKAAMLWNGSWQARGLKTAMPNADSVVAVPLPRDKKDATIIHGLSYVAAAKSPNLAVAKELVSFMTNQAANEAEAANGTALPAYTGTQAPWVKLLPNANLQVFLDEAQNHAVPFPVSKNTAAWGSKEAEILPPGFSGTKSIPEVAKQMADEMDALLKKE